VARVKAGNWLAVPSGVAVSPTSIAGIGVTRVYEAGGVEVTGTVVGVGVGVFVGVEVGVFVGVEVSVFVGVGVGGVEVGGFFVEATVGVTTTVGDVVDGIMVGDGVTTTVAVGGGVVITGVMVG
jgi:hypothetical protein